MSPSDLPPAGRPAPHWRTWHPLGHMPGFLRDPVGLFTEAHRRHGPAVHLRMVFSVLSINTPAAAQRILVENARNYVKDTPGYTVLRRLLGQGLVTAEGADWKRKRRIANPAFHRRCLAGFVQTMNDETAAWVDTLAAPGALASPRELHSEMTRLTLRIAGLTLFHVDLTAASDSVATAVRAALGAFNDQLLSAIPAVSWLPTPGARRMTAAIDKLDRVVQGIIEQRRRDPEQEADLLGMLMGLVDDETGTALDDRELRDEVVTTLLAGHETTANGLAWGLWLLADNPAVVDRIAAELAAESPEGPIDLDTLARLPVLRATVREILRLYPPIWLMARKAVNDDVLDGFHVPAGTVCFFSPWLIQRDPAWWPDPLRFSPDRFLDEAVAKARPPGAWLPFSSGARKCIGDRFAEAEMAVVLGQLLRHHTLRRAPGHTPGQRASVALGPEHGVKLLLARRG